MSCRDYRVGESFRRTAFGKNFKPQGMDEFGAKELSAFQARMEQVRKEGELRKQAFAPIGRILAADESAKHAVETLREQTLAGLAQQNQISDGPPPPKHGPPLSISGSGCAWSSTPYDAEWALKFGQCLCTASKTSGVVNTSLGMSSGDSQWADGGIMVLVVPQFASDVLTVSADVRLTYNWDVKTVWFPTAHTNGRFRILVYSYPSGVPTNALDRSQVLWSAGSSGIDDEQFGSNDFWESPSFTLTGSPVYEVWFLIYNQGDTGSGGPGWSRSSSHLWMTLQDVCVKDCQCG
jgi:hypothetical protein